jgi:hypothetical protein
MALPSFASFSSSSEESSSSEDSKAFFASILAFLAALALSTSVSAGLFLSLGYKLSKVGRPLFVLLLSLPSVSSSATSSWFIDDRSIDLDLVSPSLALASVQSLDM